MDHDLDAIGTATLIAVADNLRVLRIFGLGKGTHIVFSVFVLSPARKCSTEGFQPSKSLVAMPLWPGR
jgi:hypothetical protein